MKKDLAITLLSVALAAASVVIVLERLGIVDWLDKDGYEVVTEIQTKVQIDTVFQVIPKTDVREVVRTVFRDTGRTDTISEIVERFFVDTLVEVRFTEPNFYVDSVEFESGVLRYGLLTNGTLEGFFPEFEENRILPGKPQRWSFGMGAGMMRGVDYRGFVDVVVMRDRLKFGGWTDFKNYGGVSVGLMLK